MTSSVRSPLINGTSAWKALEAHRDTLNSPSHHLRHLLHSSVRCSSLVVEYDHIVLDYSRQRVTEQTIPLLLALAEEARVHHLINRMAKGDHINTSESRAALHIALRANEGDHYSVEGSDVVPLVRQVVQHIFQFAQSVRSGHFKGTTGKPLRNVVAIGIGGSYLGANFVYEALRCDPTAAKEADNRQLRFLANVDPVGVTRALEGLQADETLAIVISKTFTTRETMLNARTLRNWFTSTLGEKSVAQHMIACSTNNKAVKEFGIDPANTFEFWDWVGGRYSVTSAVGLVPLALHFGPDVVEQFLAGARSIDQHFLTAPLHQNLPVIMGLLGVWNNDFLGFHSRALACYSEAMLKLAPHIQQVDMESNGKSVTKDGQFVTYPTGPVNFGEPGTNAQHSFFQLFHQGQVVPVDFIGFAHSQTPIYIKGEEVSNHDELMANFFAQPDALAVGKTEEELKAEGVSGLLVSQRSFPGNRPSNVLLLPKLTAYEIGQILALYEHRTVVEGAVWNINSFDQWGVELGKKLADKVRTQLVTSRKDISSSITSFNPSTNALLTRYIRLGQAKL